MQLALCHVARSVLLHEPPTTAKRNHLLELLPLPSLHKPGHDLRVHVERALHVAVDVLLVWSHVEQDPFLFVDPLHKVLDRDQA